MKDEGKCLLRLIVIILVFIVLLVLMLACERQRCRECVTFYDPIVIKPVTFSVCTDEEFRYWDGREATYIDQFGNHVTSKTICR